MYFYIIDVLVASLKMVVFRNQEVGQWDHLHHEVVHGVLQPAGGSTC